MSAVGDHVFVQLSIDSLGLARQGFGEIAVLSHNMAGPERILRYSSNTGAAADWPTDSPEYLAIAAALAQTPKPRTVAVIRATGTVTQRYDFSVVTAVAGRTYSFVAEGEGVTATTISYTALENLSFVPGDVTTGTDSIAEVGHGMTTGDGPYRFSNTGGGLPAGLTADTNYWIIASASSVETPNAYKVASTRANALTETAVDLTTAGTGTHTLLRAANDVIIAQLVTQLNLVVGLNFLATQTAGALDTDTGRVTATAAGEWFSLGLSKGQRSSLAISQTHAAPTDVTLATDLNNILLEDSGWYALYTLYNSSAYILEAAAWTQSNGRTYFVDSCDTAILTTTATSGTDVFKQLNDLNVERIFGMFYPRTQRLLGMREGGSWLPTDPGKATPKFRTLAGIEGLTDLTDTEKTNLRAKRGNTYEQVLPDRAFFWEGTVFSTTYGFLDVTRNADWCVDNLSKILLGIFLDNDIVPFTPLGITMMEQGMTEFGGLAEAQGVLAPGWVIEVPLFEDVSDADKADRNLRNLKISGVTQGAIHKAIPVDIVLSF